MTDYRIICVTQSKPGGHDGHIVNVGTGPTTASYTGKWTVAEVWQAIDQRHTFHTISPSTGKRAEVRKWECRTCKVKTLRSNPDASADNNLDNLPSCG